VPEVAIMESTAAEATTIMEATTTTTESATITESASHTTVESAASEAATAHAAAAKTATAHTATPHTATVETTAPAATKAAAAHAATAAVAATTTAATAATAAATSAAATSQRHCWRSQANGRNCQQRDHRLAQHNHILRPRYRSQPPRYSQMAIVSENRYWLRGNRRSTLREPRLIKLKFSERVACAAPPKRVHLLQM
jgi:hypothetical protein